MVSPIAAVRPFSRQSLPLIESPLSLVRSISTFPKDSVRFGNRYQPKPEDPPKQLTKLGKVGLYGGGVILALGLGLTLLSVAHVPIGGIGLIGLAISLPTTIAGVGVMVASHKWGRASVPPPPEPVDSDPEPPIAVEKPTERADMVKPTSNINSKKAKKSDLESDEYADMMKDLSASLPKFSDPPKRGFLEKALGFLGNILSYMIGDLLASAILGIFFN